SCRESGSKSSVPYTYMATFSATDAMMTESCPADFAFPTASTPRRPASIPPPFRTSCTLGVPAMQTASASIPYFSKKPRSCATQRGNIEAPWVGYPIFRLTSGSSASGPWLVSLLLSSCWLESDSLVVLLSCVSELSSELVELQP